MLDISGSQRQPIIGDIGVILDKEHLEIHFQAIICFDAREPIGYEALLRPKPKSGFSNPGELFEAAALQHLLPELDLFCLEQAMETFQERALAGKLFLNIVPENLRSLPQLMASKNFNPQKLVVEISEKYPLVDIEHLLSNLGETRTQGLEIAIDDLGAGYSGLKTWSLIKPNYVKVDRHFITNIDKDAVKREFLRSILEIARGLRSHVIAEGIETPEEYDTISSLHIHYGQGFFIEKPVLNPRTELELPPAKAHDIQHSLNLIVRPSETVDTILYKVTPIGDEARADQANDIFKNNPALSTLPVVKDGKPIGVVSRTRILEVFSGRFSHELNWRKSVTDYLEPKVIAVDCKTPIQQVSQLITSEDHINMNVDFLITCDDKYAGIGKITSLLKGITDMQVRYARYSNPLTQLPGNVPVYEWVDSLLAENQHFHIAYVDINNFKPYNDHYGYSRGDEVISSLANTISNCVSQEHDKVGHIGGDDFVIIFRNGHCRETCEAILEQFEALVPSFYASEDVKAGGITGYDRQGNESFFPLLTLAIGVNRPDPKKCFSHHDVARLATSAKAMAKKQGGNHLFFCRRQGPNGRQVNRKTLAGTSE
jgi:EAL domain-containing protein (putative c-di-GMP-specific phosphodiesterase class I)/GGDEF domain-containing protein